MKKGQPGPIKAKSHASRMKQMVLAFFGAEGVIYTQGRDRERRVHQEGPGKVFYHFQAGEANRVVPGVVSALGQRSSSHHRHCPGVLGSERHQDDPPTRRNHLIWPQSTFSSSQE